jgi:hypothetical protein
MSNKRSRLEEIAPIDSLKYSTKDNAQSRQFIHVEIMRGARGR